MVRLQQHPRAPRLTDVRAAVRQALSRTPLPRGGTVALGVGSRGIAELPAIVGEVVACLRESGVRPFIVPAMGSHGGATAEGQRAVLAEYGVTESRVGCPVRATMDVVSLGDALGLPVLIDRLAAEADAIAVINRVKPHTDFKGGIESGLMKMLAFGLGKQAGAARYHREAAVRGHEAVILAVARALLASGRMAFGLGVVENDAHEPARVAAFTAATLEPGERALLRTARALMPRLPGGPFDVLIVDRIGKDISGGGMDPHVVGRPTLPGVVYPHAPAITWIVALGLSEASRGNAMGIGSADFITAGLVARIDYAATLANCLAAGAPGDAKIPATFPTDRAAVEAALVCLSGPPAHARVARIASTLALRELQVSEACLPDLRDRDDVTLAGDPSPMGFDPSGALAD